MTRFHIILLLSLIIPWTTSRAAYLEADQLGDTETFYAYNYYFDSTQNRSTYSVTEANNFAPHNGEYVEIDATCRLVSPKAYYYVAANLWSEVEAPGSLSHQEIGDLAARFDGTTVETTAIYNHTRESLGHEGQALIYGDEERVTILIYDIDGDSDGYRAGDDYRSSFYDPSNKELQSTQFPYSNERKLIYLDSYPTMGHSGEELDIRQSYGPLAQSLARMIVLDNHPQQEPWLVDGLSDWAAISNKAQFNSTFIDSFLHMGGHGGNFMSDRAGNRADRGAAVTLIAYLAEQAGQVALQKIVANSDLTGSAALQANLVGIELGDFISNWHRANYLAGSGGYYSKADSTLGAPYSYDSLAITRFDRLQLGDIRPGADADATLITGSSYTDDLKSYGCRYLAIAPPSSFANIELTFSGESKSFAVAVALKWGADKWRIRQIPLDESGNGLFLIDGLAERLVDEVVVIVSNQTSHTRKFSLELRHLDNSAPQAPAAFTATGHDGYIELNWQENSELDIYGYAIFKDDGRKLETIPLLHPPYFDSAVTNDLEYSYWVKAIDQQDLRSEPSSLQAVTPNPLQPPEEPFADKSGGGGSSNNNGCFVASSSSRPSPSKLLSHLRLWLWQ